MVRVKGYCVKAHDRKPPKNSKKKSSKSRSKSLKSTPAERVDDKFFQEKVLPHRKGSGATARSGYLEHIVNRLAEHHGATSSDPMVVAPKTSGPVNILTPRRKRT